MALTVANHHQIIVILVSQLKMEKTCSLISRVHTSQLPRWKYGKSQRWNNDEKERERERKQDSTIYDSTNYLK
jgi:hypothetical protein